MYLLLMPMIISIVLEILKFFSNVKGYIVSPSASAGTIDVTIDGTAPETNSVDYIRATFAAGDIKNLCQWWSCCI